MSTIAETADLLAPSRKLNLFERCLTLWVGLCMLAGVGLGKAAPFLVAELRNWEFGHGSQVNLPIVLVEVPVMLSVCGACNRTRWWFSPPTTA